VTGRCDDGRLLEGGSGRLGSVIPASAILVFSISTPTCWWPCCRWTKPFLNVTDRSDDITRRASDNRFRRDREALNEALAGLLGARLAIEALSDADRAAAIAAEATAGHRAAEDHGWALVRHASPTDDRAALVALLHAIERRLESRAVWLVVPGREPQVVPLTSDVVLDNPLGFAALADFELVLLDQQVPAGLWVGRHVHDAGAGAVAHSWELEVWGAEPWLSAATRALREQGGSDAPAG
jgi:hypothetical protein